MPQNSMARDEAGNIWEVDAQGNAIRLVQAAGQANQMPADPTYQYQGQQAAADLTGTQASTASAQASADRTRTDTAVTQATMPSTVSTANLPSGYRWIDPANPSLGAEPIPGTEAARDAERGAVSTNASAAAELLRLIDDPNGLQSIYDSEFMNQGVRSLGEYTWGGLNQSEALANLQAQNDAALPLIKRFMRVPGEGANSDRDQQAYLDLLPDPNSRDSANQTRIDNMRQAALSVLRQEGIDTTSYDPASEDTRGSVWAQPRIVNQGPQMQVSDGQTTSVPVNPEMQAEYQAWVLANIGGENFTPQAYAAMRHELDRKYGYSAGADYEAEGRRMLENFQEGSTLNLNMPPIEREMSGVERFRNNIANSNMGAAAIGLADAGGFGGVTALAPEQMAALRNERPYSMLAGEVVGAIGGTAALGKLGRETFGRAIPSTMANTGRAQFGRNLAADVAYSGIYGGVTGADPLESMAWGGAGSALGQGAGRLLGGAARGIAESQPVQALRQRGIPLTVGQSIGGTLGRIEERAMSFPVIGDMIRNRRLESLGAFNRAAFDEAGQPINASVTQTGLEGIGQLDDQLSAAYNHATAGARVPFDAQFRADMADVGQLGQRLPRPERRRLGQILEARVLPLTGVGEMTGETFQQARRGLRSARNNPPQQFAGFEDFYRDAVTAADDALESQMRRGGGDSVIAGLDAANAANRNIRTLEDAVTRARSGSATEEIYQFSPYQLQSAGHAALNRFPGQRPFAELADAGQQVLPNRVPNSGTTDRAMQALLPGLTVGGAGLGYAAGGNEGAATGGAIPLTLAALAALGGTRRGQQFINQSLTRRPDSMRRLGDWTLRHSGLFGSGAMAPVVIGQQ